MLQCDTLARYSCNMLLCKYMMLQRVTFAVETLNLYQNMILIYFFQYHGSNVLLYRATSTHLIQEIPSLIRAV